MTPALSHLLFAAKTDIDSLNNGTLQSHGKPPCSPFPQIFDLASHRSKVYSHKKFNKLYNACQEWQKEQYAISDIGLVVLFVICRLYMLLKSGDFMI